MNPPGRRALSSLLLLATCGAAYVLFHWHRRELPHGFVRDSFPSLLLPSVIFGLVDLRPKIRFRSERIRLLVFSITLVAAIVWFEVLIPAVNPRSIGDWKDGAAMVLGFGLYLLQDFLKRAFVARGSRSAAVAACPVT